MILQATQRLHVDVRAPGDTMTVFHPPIDTSVFERIIRWFFSVPQWVQLAGIAVALIVGVIALVLVWKNASAIRDWVRDRHLNTPLFWKTVIGVQAIAVLLLLATAGAGFFVYSQNNNQFCLSCHTLHDEVYQRFQQSKHHRVANLRCHDCHSEPLLAEAAQVGKWILFRPSEVGPHAPVPRAVCAKCHIKEKPDSTWQRIIATAGHSVHVMSDTAKKLRVECLTCHGVTAHRFVPVAETCAQSGCHKKMDIRLGKMAGQTSLHCTTCHQFTAPVQQAGNTAGNTAAALSALSPNAGSCLGCHEMRKVIERFRPDDDPHKGQCGDCHNPHTQTRPVEAYKTCTNVGCHARPDTLTPFHRGIHAGKLQQCGTCHKEHSWKVQGKTCLDCHQDIFKKEPKPAFRSSKVSDSPALRLASAGDATQLVVGAVATAAAETTLFSHGTHSRVACSSCHSTKGPSHGTVTLRSARDCQQCHHGASVREFGGGTKACLHCHTQKSLAMTARPVATLKPRTVASRDSTTSTFAHTTHTSVGCASCHATGGSAPGAVTVRAPRDCQQCHHGPTVRQLGGGTDACLHCHKPQTLPDGRGAPPITRPMTFAHTTHEALTCNECHTTSGGMVGPAPTCNSCHDRHHVASRNCSACHTAYEVHRGKSVHLGCAGSGCHNDRAVLALGPTRNVCLACHATQVEHMPGRDCATCHRVSWPGLAQGVRR